MSVLLMWRRRGEVEDLDVFFGMIHQFVRSNILRIEVVAAPAPAKTMTMLLLRLMMMMMVALLLQRII
jgi:hypothetical protein